MISSVLTWHGHAAWSLVTERGSLIVDPFFEDASLVAQVPPLAHVLVSHGHYDHVGQAADLLQRFQATLVGNFEICNWFAAKHSIKSTEPMNIGGRILTDSGSILMVPALHSSIMPDGSYGGNPCGFVVSIAPPEKAPGDRLVPLAEELASWTNIYFACDTGLFDEMRWIGSLGIDVAVLPIGDRFTMGPSLSLEAIRWINPKHVFPSHFGTWPPIAQDVDRWAAGVREYTDAEPVVLRPNDCWHLQ